MIPGEMMTREGEITLNEGRETLVTEVSNSGDRPIQVGSHYHFYETNEALRFDREKTRGFRLDIPAGTAVRFRTGADKNGDACGLWRQANRPWLQWQNQRPALGGWGKWRRK